MELWDRYEFMPALRVAGGYGAVVMMIGISGN